MLEGHQIGDYLALRKHHRKIHDYLERIKYANIKICCANLISDLQL